MIHVDYETYSPLDFKVHGASKAMSHPKATAILMAVSHSDSRDVYVWDRKNDPEGKRGESKQAREMFMDHTGEFCAHNAPFEIMVTGKFFEPRYAEVDRWHCTMASAARANLPLGLGNLALTLGVGDEKDTAGKDLIKRFCSDKYREKKVSLSHDEIAQVMMSSGYSHALGVMQAAGFKGSQWCKLKKLLPLDAAIAAKAAREDAEGWLGFIEYCRQDVVVEKAVYAAMKNVHPRGWIRRWWVSEITMYAKGLPLDVGALQVANEFRLRLRAEALERSMEIAGASPRQVAKMIEWLASKGVVVPNLQKETVGNILATEGLPDEVYEVLGVRASASMAAVDKIPKMLDMVEDDGHVRDHCIWHGALTGRPVGRGMQPLNLKRVEKWAERITPHAIEFLRSGAPADIELLGDPLPVLANCMRHFIRPTDGSKLLDVDYSSVEAMLTAYVCGANVLLGRFERGEDVYMLTACEALSCAPSKEVRFMGKQTVLSCQYQVGADKLAATSKLPLAQTRILVRAYRRDNPEIPGSWKELNLACIAAVMAPGSRHRVLRNGLVEISCLKVFPDIPATLCIKLPSGRTLFYNFVEVVRESKVFKDPDTGEPLEWMCDQIRYSSGNQWSPKSEAKFRVHNGRRMALTYIYGGKILENIVQAIAADIMAQSIVRATEAGYDLRLSVYDQLVAVKHEGYSLQGLTDIMTQVPSWLPGFPLKAEGHEDYFFTKH